MFLATVFNIKMYINNVFNEQQSAYWNEFLQDHVTLRTGIKTAENSAVPSYKINYILIYIKIQINHFKS